MGRYNDNFDDVEFDVDNFLDDSWNDSSYQDDDDVFPDNDFDEYTEIDDFE